MSRNTHSKIPNCKTALTKPKEMQAYMTQNTFYNPKSLKLSIGTFNKSIEYLHAIGPCKQIKPLISQNQTMKQNLNDLANKKATIHHSSVNKDAKNTNYIINNFTLSTKNLSNSPMQSESIDTHNQRDRRIESLCQLISKKDKQIEALSQKVKMKDMTINEQKAKMETMQNKYSETKKANNELKEENGKYKQLNSILEVAEKDLKQLMNLISQKKLFVQVDNDNGDGEEDKSDRILQTFDEYFCQDANVNTEVNANNEGNNQDNNDNEMTYISMEKIECECESTSFTPLNIDPIKSLKRLDVIPKLNFNKLYMRTELSNCGNRNRNKTKSKAKVKANAKEKEKEKENNKISIVINNDSNEEPNNNNDNIISINEHYTNTETIIDNLKHTNINTIQSNIKSEFNNNTKASYKHFFTQSNKSKSFSGKLSKMIKTNICNNIHSKYHKAFK